ncbi:N-6 DNA methylase [Candidatus Chloroploca asiatica]|uniref:N-6 DNA methylase n=1 Tax=Candidatus Chloroploca asiatica TaxID=1506545 RepID=UPI0015586825|nr:N-6 DNA methylase [Candidatus Chloroploca asiatica]
MPTIKELRQQNLFNVLQDNTSHEKIYANAFRKLYYHLYSNSNASRAERIMSDLSSLLLCKVIGERNGKKELLEQFLDGKGSANSILLPMLHEAFPHLVDNEDRFSLEDAVLRYALQEIISLPLTGAPAHVLGEAFQSLIGPRLRGDKGQFFTPKSLVRSIINVLQPTEGAKIVDPACGTGGFLVEVQAFLENSRGSRKKRLTLIGIDKDRDLARLAEAILEIVAPNHATVLNQNSLDLKSLALLPEETNPFNADYVITNPPFGANIKITDSAILKNFALGYRWNQNKGGIWEQNPNIREAQDPQILFIELCIKLLKPSGMMGIVLPEGVFGNSTYGYVWDFIRSQGEIFALIDCPRTTFQPGTDTKTNVLFFRKANSTGQTTKTNMVWTAVAIHCGHDRRGRNTMASGDPYPDDFKTIGETFVTREMANGLWQQVNIKDPYYLVPRYYDKSPLSDISRDDPRFEIELVSLREMAKSGHLKIRKGHEVGSEAYGTGDIPFVRTSDISNYEVSIDPTRSVSEEVYEEYAPLQQLAPGDILIVSDGRYRIGRTAILHSHNYKCVVQSHVKIITVTDKSPINSIELLYLLSLPMVQHQIRNLVFIQSTLGALGSRIGDICIPKPKRNTQWHDTIEEFRQLIEQRAKLLTRLREFDNDSFEL